MRVIVYGAGAIGGAIGGRLAQHGHDVVLIARGAHHDALVERGLTLASPDGTVELRMPVVREPSGITFTDGDVVVLGMKGQDTAAAVRTLEAVAPPDLPIVCAQNGVENERVALRSFANVQGMCVMCPATHLEPGVVLLHSDPVGGLLDVGRYPSGVDDTSTALAALLTESGFRSDALADVMRWKHRKLLMNLANSVEAACGTAARGSDLVARAQAEGEACFAAAGLDVATAEEDQARRGELIRMRPIDGRRREGGSSWQSLQRGGSIEADLLNGEIVLLGRLHGVPTPVNAALQRAANRLARAGARPGSMAIDDLEREVGAA